MSAELIQVNGLQSVRYWPMVGFSNTIKVLVTQSPALGAWKFRDVKVGKNSVVIDGAKQYHLNQAPHREVLCETGHFVEPNPCTLLGGNTNFGHWVFEYLTRLPILDRLGLTERRLAVWDDVPQRFLDFINILYPPMWPIARVKPGTFADVIIPDCPIGRMGDNSPFLWADCIHELRSKSARFRKPSPKRGLFLRRPGSMTRSLENQDEIINALHPYGFEAVDLAGMTAQEQLETIGDARMIVSPIGAGSAITLFTDAAIIELGHAGIDGMFGSKLFAAVNGNPFTRLDGTVLGGIPSRDSFYTVAPEIVVSTAVGS